MNKEASYILSAYSIICTQPVDELLNAGNQMQNGNPIPSFDQQLLIDLCFEAQQIFEKESNILEIEGDFIIVGDIHGSLHDLLRILKFINEKKSKVLFLGDYVDRGNFSLECITLIFALKILYPDSVYLIRGNHEFDSICSQYGFKNEILNYSDPKMQENTNDKNMNNQFIKYYVNHKNMDCYKYTESLYNAFIDAFSYLPICAILNKTTFCVHGGLSPKLEFIDQINETIKRPIRKFEECTLLTELVWSDPISQSNHRFDPNPRGNGYLFNREAVHYFLKTNSLKRMIRAHQCVHKGCLKNFGDKCITVFSVSSYGRFLGNSSAVLQLSQSEDLIAPIVFLPIRHLKKSDANYYKVQSFDQKYVPIDSCFSLSHPKLITIEKVTRKIPNRSILKTNSNIRNKSAYLQSYNCYGIPLTKPKFVTNSRKSYPNGSFNAFLSTVSSNVCNENSCIVDENNTRFNIFNSSP